MSPFYRWKKQGLEDLHNLAKVTWLISEWAKVGIQACLYPELPIISFSIDDW